MTSIKSEKAYQWVATLYFFQAMPFVVVSLIATLYYQQQGVDNALAALISSLLLIPWAIKPLFAPRLERFLTKKRITIFTQGLIALLFFSLALSVNQRHFLLLTTFCFACLALISSIHDIVSDGVYLLNLNEDQQKNYVALRTFFFQMGRLLIKGGLVAIFGKLAMNYGFNIWEFLFYSLFALALFFAVYHGLKIPESEKVSSQIKKSYFFIYKQLLSSKEFLPALLFIFLYNFTEAQMQKIVPLFLLDKKGLNLDLLKVGEIYGISGSIALMTGIFISGILLSRYSLARCLKKLTLLLVCGHFFFLLLAYHSPTNYEIYATVIFSQFTYGLANGAYMAYLLSFANQSAYPMSMYTLCTATMALSYVFFGTFSGYLEQQLGYTHFFLVMLIANIFLVFLTYKRMANHG